MQLALRARSKVLFRICCASRWLCCACALSIIPLHVRSKFSLSLARYDALTLGRARVFSARSLENFSLNRFARSLECSLSHSLCLALALLRLRSLYLRGRSKISVSRYYVLALGRAQVVCSHYARLLETSLSHSLFPEKYLSLRSLKIFSLTRYALALGRARPFAGSSLALALHADSTFFSLSCHALRMVALEWLLHVRLKNSPSIALPLACYCALALALFARSLKTSLSHRSALRLLCCACARSICLLVHKFLSLAMPCAWSRSSVYFLR